MTRLATFALVCCASAAFAGEPKRKVVFENEKVRVVEVAFDPGDEEAEHTHPLDMVAIVIEGGSIESTASDGTVTKQGGKPGDVFFLAKGSTHRAKNASGGRVVLRVVAVK